jgi:hypothetical protein
MLFLILSNSELTIYLINLFPVIRETKGNIVSNSFELETVNLYVNGSSDS